jgi:dipeptidyl aminopeptidase/acylaminoacyl peptidase
VASAETRDHKVVPEDYFEIAWIMSTVVSPDGKLAAYVESRWGEGKEGRKNDLWVIELSGGDPFRLTFDGFGPRHLTWSRDGRWIYLLGRDPHGTCDQAPYDGCSQVWRISPDGSTRLQVTRIKDGAGQYELAGDGKTLYYTTGEEIYEDEWQELRKQFSDLEYGHGVTEYDAIWRLDLVSWRSEQVRPAEDVIYEMSLAPDGRHLALVTQQDTEIIFREGWSQVEVLDLASGESELVTPEGWRNQHPSPYGWIDSLAWSGDSRALGFVVSFDGYASQILVAEWRDQQTSHLQTVARPERVSYSGGLKWRGTGRTLCYLGDERARSRIYAATEVGNGTTGSTEVLTPGDLVATSFSFSALGEVMAAVIGTTSHLEDIFTMRGDQGTLRRVTNVNPQVDSWQLPQIAIVTWTGADGDTIEGILELPPGYTRDDGPLPMVVELHGGPTAATPYMLRLWIYGRTLMPARGYALFSPNYHGSTGYGDEIMEKLIGRENEIEVTDIRTGIEALIEQGIADPDRIGVMGWSNGGFLTNAMITAMPDVFKAASSGAGVLDMVIQWATEDTPGHVINFMKGLPWERPEAYQKGSPIYALDRIKTPTLIHVGGNDPRVPPAHSRGLYRALRHYLDVPVELIVYPGEPHSLTTHENRLAKMKWDHAWFDHYLLGTGD